MDGENNGKPYLKKNMIWGENPPTFGNTHVHFSAAHMSSPADELGFTRCGDH